MRRRTEKALLKVIDQITDLDAQAVIEHAMTGKALDPAIARRIQERSGHATEELRRKHGTLNVAVDLVRAGRDEE